MIGIAVCIFLLVLMLVVAEKVFERTNFYKLNYCETDKFHAVGKVDYVNTGSTFASYGFDYKLAGVNGLNLALCPQPLAADYKLLKHFEGRYNSGATVFITIADLAFAKQCYTERNVTDKYYKILSRSELALYHPLKALRAKYFPVLYSWKNFLRFYRDIRLNNDRDICVNENDLEAIEADAYKRCKSWMQEFALKNLQDGKQGSRFTKEFSYTRETVTKMVMWCREHDLKPVLVNLPVTNEMAKNFSQEFLDAFYYDHIHKLVQELNVKFIDLQENERLTDYLLYLDSCRLNKAGREIITKRLLAEVNKQV